MRKVDFGSATIDEPVAAAHPVVEADGRILRSTMERMQAGFSSKPLPIDVVERIRDQAVSLIEDCVGAYSEKISTAEVGLGGSARAAPDATVGAQCPTGLLYGRIQSGKTNAMILATALAIDNGFRVVIVLTSDNVALVEQTVSRFRVLDEGPLVYSSTSGQWDADRDNIARHLARHGVVFVCTKNSERLSSLIDILTEVRAADYPALIFDDEADQATLDTTTAARAGGRASAPPHGSTTYRLTVLNDAASQQGESIRETLRHNVFVQVTATPYALLLQNLDSPLRPSFTRLLEPGPGYTGGESFFSIEHVDCEKRPMVFVDANETAGVSASDRQAPTGLAKAIAFFLIASSVLKSRRRRPEPDGYKFLCHTSSKQQDHDRFASVIRNHADGLFDAASGTLRPEHRPTFEWAHADIAVTWKESLPPLNDLLDDLGRRIQQRRVIVVNAAAEQGEFGSAFNFLVGGNILGRGLTIDNLLVTYYMRMPRTTQMDTMLQHARMFGYRSEIMPFTRVFLSPVLAARFARITESERGLRQLLETQSSSSPVPVQIVGNLRPTRANVLDPNSLGGIRPGQQIYPSVPASNAEQIGNSTARVEAQIGRLVDDWRARAGDFIDCSIDHIVELVKTVRSGDPDSNDWEPEILANVLLSISSRYVGRAYLCARTFTTARTLLVNGAISGSEQRRARAANRPVLFMLREAGDHDPWTGGPFWYPTLVFPMDMANQVFNVT